MTQLQAGCNVCGELTEYGTDGRCAKCRANSSAAPQERKGEPCKHDLRETYMGQCAYCWQQKAAAYFSELEGLREQVAQARNEARVFEEQAIENWRMVQTRESALRRIAEIRCGIPGHSVAIGCGAPQIAQGALSAYREPER